MDREMYKHITGIDEFFQYFPQVHWCYFDQMQEFRWYREFDYEEWRDRFCVELTMSDMGGQDIIQLKLKSVSGDCACDFTGSISGLEIVNLKYNDISHEIHYEVYDFEYSQIHLYCDDIEVKVLSVKGKKIEG